MNYVKHLVTAVLLCGVGLGLSGAGSAVATTLCNGTPPAEANCSSLYTTGTTLDASVDTTTKVSVGGLTASTCTEGTATGSLTNAGGATTTVAATLSEWTWGSCSVTTVTTSPGSLEVHHIAGTDNGTLTSTNTVVTMALFGADCEFGTTNTEVGTLTGGNPGIWDISSILPEVSERSGCPSSAGWSGSYKITGPSGTLDVTAGTTESKEGSVLCSSSPAAETDCSSPYTNGTTIDFSVEATTKLSSFGITLDTCTGGTAKGTIGNQGGTTELVSGSISELTWNGCTVTTNALSNGSIAVDHIAGTNNGNITSNGAEVTVNFAGDDCVFGTSNTTVGTLTGGRPATWDISSTLSELSGRSGCPSSAGWSGSYKLTEPSGTLDVTGGGGPIPSEGTILCSSTPAAGAICPGRYAEGTMLDTSVETTAKLSSFGITLDTCTGGTAKGTIANEGGSTQNVSGNIAELTWSGCTVATTTLVKGSLEVIHIVGTDNGTVKSSGAEVTVNFAGSDCVFGTAKTDIGTLTGGAPATFDISGTIPEVSERSGCPANGGWSGNYKITEPSGTLDIVSG